jgi:hypothetical protein
MKFWKDWLDFHKNIQGIKFLHYIFTIISSHDLFYLKIQVCYNFRTKKGKKVDRIQPDTPNSQCPCATLAQWRNYKWFKTELSTIIMDPFFSLSPATVFSSTQIRRWWQQCGSNSIGYTLYWLRYFLSRCWMKLSKNISFIETIAWALRWMECDLNSPFVLLNMWKYFE